PKYLPVVGYSCIEIIRYYFGNDMYIATADIISGVPSSYPGYDLNIGASGDKVRQLQLQLNRIARNYPAIPTLTPDGVYGPATAESVRIFQGIFGLPQTGVTDYATWYEVSDIYVGVTRISEPG
ncbi:MAG: peptidoglycan-binding protein, partial [Acetatifactor sp.]|nr:peptidoglycan-binding protein [Acetatifactor sp.]